MKRLAIVICAAVCLAFPAVAQDQSVSTQILLAGSSCSEQAGVLTPQAAIDLCEAKFRELQALKQRSTLTAHETNLYWVMLALTRTTIGSKMGAIDRVRSARTCQQLEIAWTAYANVIPANSPADYAADMVTMKQQAVAPVLLCRSEFGTPAGATPTP